MSQLKTLREVDDPYDASSIEAAIETLCSEVLFIGPTDPNEAILYLTWATRKFATQFAEDLGEVRSDVVAKWNSSAW